MTDLRLESYDESYPPELWAPAPPPIVHSTGATAGAPGTWTPAGSTPPANVTALIAGVPNVVAANPTTAWTVGQYVATGDAAQAHWSGTAWVAGAAVAVEEAAPEAAPEPPPEEPV